MIETKKGKKIYTEFEQGYMEGKAYMAQLIKNYITFDCNLNLSKPEQVVDFCKKIDRLKELNNDKEANSVFKKTKM